MQISASNPEPLAVNLIRVALSMLKFFTVAGYANSTMDFPSGVSSAKDDKAHATINCC